MSGAGRRYRPEGGCTQPGIPRLGANIGKPLLPGDGQELPFSPGRCQANAAPSRPLRGCRARASVMGSGRLISLTWVQFVLRHTSAVVPGPVHSRVFQRLPAYRVCRRRWIEVRRANRFAAHRRCLPSSSCECRLVDDARIGLEAGRPRISDNN
jgi:hypothetical protein